MLKIPNVKATMKHTVKTLKAALTKLAAKYKSRRSFNGAVSKKFPFIDDGVFRRVHDAGTFVIKVRQHENDSDFDDWQIDDANTDEMCMYDNLVAEAPSVAFFVLAPVYLALPNGHDAIIMPKVSVVANDEHFGHVIGTDEDCCDLRDYIANHMSPLMYEQFVFITDSFSDMHDGNIGWDAATGRVWCIDYNLGSEGDSSDPHVRKMANMVMKRVIRSTRKKKAA